MYFKTLDFKMLGFEMLGGHAWVANVMLTALLKSACPTPTYPGYVSGTYFKMLGGHAWVANVMLTAVLWFGPVTIVFSFLNTVAIFYRVGWPRPFLSGPVFFLFAL